MAPQRVWFPPDSAVPGKQLHLYNSALDEKVPFVPRAGPDSRTVTWYCCGPTVYDAAHLGHARNYVTFDIIRRVLEDYFGYNVFYIMNVTDVDDKIILRARRNHLFSGYMKEGNSLETVLELCLGASKKEVEGQESKCDKSEKLLESARQAGDSRRSKELAAQLDGEKLKLRRAQETLESLQALQSKPPSMTAEQLGEKYQDTISAHLDKEKGQSVTDKDIFRLHAAKYEAEFFQDLEALGVRMPSAAPRVTDHIPEIVAFVSKLEEQDLAYAAGSGEDRSVYFNCAKFKDAGHTYGKLKPWAVGCAELAAEGESNFTTSEKRSPQDFVLWKASKSGEPAWDSPWGKGRPGWHIECNAMIDATAGGRLDVHSGGEDLKFPHHDNEIALSEACYCGCNPPTGFSEQWCTYWLHSGHLSIDGLKMSKSLKNFITIRQALAEFSARQLRLLFLLQPWNAPMTFNQQSRSEMVQKEATLRNFFLNVQVVLRENPLENSSTVQHPLHTQLQEALASCQNAVHAALLDNIATHVAMQELLKLVSTVNVYISEDCPSNSIRPDALRVRRAAVYITRILSVFGLSDGFADGPIGFSSASAAAGSSNDICAAVRAVFAMFCAAVRSIGDSAAEALQAASAAAAAAADGEGPRRPEELLAGLEAGAALDRFVDVRLRLRAAARGKMEKAVAAAILRQCDFVRDGALMELGIKVEDVQEGSVWKHMDPADLRREIEEKKRAAVAAASEKLARKLQSAQDELVKAKRVLAYSSAQAAMADRFKFDTEGNAVQEFKEDTWVDVDDKRRKAITKLLEKEEKARAPIMKKAKADTYLPDLEAQVDDLAKQLQKLEAELG